MEGDAPEERITHVESLPMVDWRMIERWGLDSSALPPDTRRRFYEPSLWESRPWEIAGAMTVLLLQSATIAGLIVTDRRRRRFKEQLAQERLELAHLSRTTQLGALSGSFAHELNQPLAAILANAEAGSRMLDAESPDLDEIRAILEDIAEDDRRAADVIAQLRPMMLKGEATLEPLDLNAAAASALALARSELASRGDEVQFSPDPAPLMVMGNLVQLKQLILNLLMNASEAMADLPAERRRIVVETRRRENGGAELSVADEGRGLPEELRPDPFRAFVSTKPDGMGLGLSICRSIALAHGGGLEFDGDRERGARVVLALPPPKETA